MVITGVDPHKRTHTASAVQPGASTVLATLQIDASLAGYRRLLKWGARFESRRWAVENARGLGRHLAQWLVARGEVVEASPRRRPRGCVSCLEAAAARTTSSTPPQRPASRRSPRTLTRSWVKT